MMSDSRSIVACGGGGDDDDFTFFAQKFNFFCGADILTLKVRAPCKKAMSQFQTRHSFAMRKAEADRIKERYPARIPVIVERASRAADIPQISKSKFLAPQDMSVGQFIYIIRKSISLPPEKALFLFCGQTLPTTATLMRQLYAENGDEDGENQQAVHDG